MPNSKASSLRKNVSTKYRKTASQPTKMREQSRKNPMKSETKAFRRAPQKPFAPKIFPSFDLKTKKAGISSDFFMFF
ncbi:MAG: hypothetical protein SOZ02_01745 [Hallerella porci]|uniref:hypothetical protein n=1 Tax=Hallerella porci TaxID=1945871 RepID=UPI0011B1CB43|nr:hypothetical protein [Hallerella porci]MCI5599989.1 hypothetical protein [Hallerella sp.]MDY3920870.1 hypothetical protein [Hallerella porci]